MSNVLAFRTPPGGVTIPAGQSEPLGVVDVANFERIRIIVDERAGSASTVTVRLTITEGNELIAHLDSLILMPQSQLTKVYEVPGRKLSILAVASAGQGLNTLDVFVYGFAR